VARFSLVLMPLDHPKPVKMDRFQTVVSNYYQSIGVDMPFGAAEAILDDRHEPVGFNLGLEGPASGQANAYL
jgi:hypothetical protein